MELKLLETKPFLIEIYDYISNSYISYLFWIILLYWNEGKMRLISFILFTCFAYALGSYVGDLRIDVRDLKIEVRDLKIKVENLK